MIKKIAILAIEKADGSVVLSAGEKGDIATQARELIRMANDSEDHDLVRVTAIGEMGVLKQRKWKRNVPDEIASQIDYDAVDTDEIRAKLKAKGVNVPGRLTNENLVKLAIASGVEV